MNIDALSAAVGIVQERLEALEDLLCSDCALDIEIETAIAEMKNELRTLEMALDAQERPAAEPQGRCLWCGTVLDRQALRPHVCDAMIRRAS